MASINLSEQTVVTSLKAAEEKLDVLERSSITELGSFVRPPIVCELILQGVGVLLEPSKKKFEWVDAKRMINNTTALFTQRLREFNKDNVSDDQLARLTSILSRQECQPECVAKVSLACHGMCLWLRAVVDYTNLRRQMTQQQTQ